MNILNFQNPQIRTAFAPQWNYVICEDDISKDINIDLIKTTILSKEKETIEQYKYTSDWGTGLGATSMTSRSDSYNLLEWPEMQDLKSAIRATHDKFLIGLGFEKNEKLYIQCWANVLRKGQSIAQHQHWKSPYTYLGGHVCIQKTNTHTSYVNPFTNDPYQSENTPGKITLFPNWIEHYTNEHAGNEERITIAFDIITQVVLDEDIFDNMKQHWIPF